MWMWSIAMAVAGSGIPFDAVPLVESVVFLPEGGWAGTIADEQVGACRVFVGQTENDAQVWLDAQSSWLPRETLPAVPFPAAVARGDTVRVLAFREGNVAVAIHRPSGAVLQVAQRLLDAIEEDSPWPADPVVAAGNGRLKVTGEWADVRFVAPSSLDLETFLPMLPSVVPVGAGEVAIGDDVHSVTVQTWDRFGRTAIVPWSRNSGAQIP